MTTPMMRYLTQAESSLLPSSSVGLSESMVDSEAVSEESTEVVARGRRGRAPVRAILPKARTRGIIGGDCREVIFIVRFCWWSNSFFMVRYSRSVRRAMFRLSFRLISVTGSHHLREIKGPSTGVERGLGVSRERTGSMGHSRQNTAKQH